MGTPVAGRREAGFALPSVLMMILIMTALTFGILALVHIGRLQALADIARVKAEYAAESGVVRAASIRGYQNQPQIETFADGSRASIRTLPWGLLKIALVEGTSGRMKATRTALLASESPREYRCALVFGNASRQLILAGTTSIVGDLLLGPMGAAVGTLPGERQGARLPISGSVLKNPAMSMPTLDPKLLDETIAPFERFLAGEVAPGRPAPDSEPPLSIPSSGAEQIPDSAEGALIQGDLSFSHALKRAEQPLIIYVLGGLTLAPGASVEGTVAFYASGSIRIERGATVDNVVFMSRDSIVIDQGFTGRGQFIAPRVSLGEDCKLSYPSVVSSYAFSGAAAQFIEFKRGSHCEGLVAMFSAPKRQNAVQSPKRDLIVVDSSATVFGALYAECPLTLDGRVDGTVVATDFYFYQAPTSYYGWLRSARINREARPEGFVVPQFMAGASGKGVVATWL